MKAEDKISARAPLYQDLRLNRAQAITAVVMRKLYAIVDNPGEVSDVLLETLHGLGVDFVTDDDRRAAGLPPRDAYGLTALELHVLEQKRIELLTRPPPPIVVNQERVGAGDFILWGETSISTELSERLRRREEDGEGGA